MKLKILEDSIKLPNCFIWYGAIKPEKLELWLKENGLKIPIDYFEFLCTTGGGDIFEGETILGPFGKAETGDDLIGTNYYNWKNGMPWDFLIFHIGLGISIIKKKDSNYCVLDENYSVKKTFKNFDDWYINYLREEYADRYELN